LLKKLFIQKLLAAVMLVLFAFSVTPKIILHKLAANHTDRPANNTDSKAQISSAGFSCAVESVVAESSFDGADNTPVVSNTSVIFLSHQYPLASTFHSSVKLTSSLRGPPGA
jgi:hypothetical protein